MKSITKTAAKITEELSQPNEKSDAKNRLENNKPNKTGRVPKKMEEQSNA